MILTRLDVIERKLGELFRLNKMFAGYAKHFPARKPELERFQLRSAKVWQLYASGVTVYVGKDTDGKNKVVMSMPDYKPNVLKEICCVLIELRVQVTIATKESSYSVQATNVAKCTCLELHHELSKIFRPADTL